MYMRDTSSVKTVFNSYVVDDGWNLPYEVMEEIEFRIAEAKSVAMERIKKLINNIKECGSLLRWLGDMLQNHGCSE